MRKKITIADRVFYDQTNIQVGYHRIEAIIDY